MGEIVLEDRHYADAVQQGERERANAPLPVSVRYEASSSRIIVEFDNGAAFMVPSQLVQGLANAKPEDLAEIELLGETGLHWPRLDVDHAIVGLMQGIFGTRAFMEAQRKGGLARSPAKAEAARRNGAKGGRPRKSV